MYNYAQLAKLTTCVIATATLIACDSASVTSLSERDTVILDDSELYICDPISVELAGTRLLGHTSSTDSTSTVEIEIPDGEYKVYLHYEDLLHSDPNQPDQLDEIWYLEGKNASGEIALVTNHTEDLPKEETTGFSDVGIYPFKGIVSLSGRHASISPEYDSIIPAYNSIEPTLAELYPVTDACYDPAT